MKIIQKLLFAFLLFSASGAIADDTRVLSAAPKEIYGANTDNIKVRLGNGGAGPTGILKALAEDYLAKTKSNYAIAWYQDISPNTLQQLKKGTIDIALVYEQDQIKQAVSQGWAKNPALIFHDHFLIVGPKENPAGLNDKDLPTEAFSKIATFGQKLNQKLFLSRDDNSGTNVKEHSIWSLVNRQPWAEKNNWYLKFHHFPKDALLKADKNSLYTITDWGTWLSNANNLKNSTIYVYGKDVLLNSCFALIGNNPSKETADFLNYLKSDDAQQLIAQFGKEKYNGLPLFSRNNQKDLY